jgi:hypothetical protein
MESLEHKVESLLVEIPDFQRVAVVDKRRKRVFGTVYIRGGREVSGRG